MTKEEMSQAITDALKPIGDRITTLEANAKPATQAAAHAGADHNRLVELVTNALKPLQTEVTALRESQTNNITANAKATVETIGIRGGRIGAQDTATIDFWTKAIAADAKAAEALAKITPNPAFVQVIANASHSGGSSTTPGALSKDKETADKISAKASAHKAAGLPFDQAWAKATSEVMGGK